MDASTLIDKQIADLGDWREDVFKTFRKLVLAADPSVTEEWKWDTAVWSQNGLLCAVGTFKDHLKFNFFKGASLLDPKKLFNAGLEAKISRAIDVYVSDEVNEEALKELITSAVLYNSSKK